MIFLHPEKIDPRLVAGMNRLLGLIRAVNPHADIVVTEDYSEPGPGNPHVTDSQHYLGRACDFHVVGLDVAQVWLLIERVPEFGGVGFYPYWRNPGFHCDSRTSDYRARWTRSATGAYAPFDDTTLSKLLEISHT